jgi:hypothetical protein
VELYEFSKILKELGDYYERAKEPRHGTIELWFDKVKNIPTEPIGWVISRIESENESFPRNLPSAMWGAYRDWMSSHPERVAHQTFHDCPDCNDGVLPARKGTRGVDRYTYTFRCGRCKQSKTMAYPMATRMQLMSEGYEVIPKGGDPDDGSMKYRNIPAVVANIGEVGTVH